MSQQDLWAVVGRAKADDDFGGQLFRDFDQAVISHGYQLDESEASMAKRLLSESPPAPPPQAMFQRFAFESELAQKRMTNQVERMNDLGSYTVKILKDTLNNAAHTFRTITWMNVVMFVTGIALYIFAALYAAFSDEKVYSLLFGGLGTASFIALFLLGPIEKSQNALSNLVQVEISFMNYFEQISFWENYAIAPQGDPPMPNIANIEKASDMLQKRSKETIELLQKYVETRAKSAGKGA